MLYLSTPHPPLPLGCPPGWYYFEKIFFSDNSSKDKDKAIISGFHGFPGLTVSPLEGLFISSTNERRGGGRLREDQGGRWLKNLCYSGGGGK